MNKLFHLIFSSQKYDFLIKRNSLNYLYIFIFRSDEITKVFTTI